MDGKEKKKFGKAFEVLGDLLRSLRSADRPTRRMTVLFFISAASFCFLLWKGFHLRPSLQLDPKQDAAHDVSPTPGTSVRPPASRRPPLLVGKFTVPLKAAGEGEAIRSRSLNLGYVEISVDCDTDETCQWIERRLEEAQDRISSALVPMDREELLSRDGKEVLKKQLMERLNIWLPEGKVVDLFFSKLIIG